MVRFWIVVVFCIPCLVALDTSKLKQQGHVNDFPHEMGTSSRGLLEQYCVQTEQKTGAQLLIVLVNSLDDEPIQSAAGKLFREWGVESKNADQGVLLLFAIQDKQEGAHVGTGLEPVLSADFVAGALGETRLALQNDDYNRPLLALAQKIGERIAKTKGVSLDPPKVKKSGWFSPIAILLYICIAAFIAGLLSIIPAFVKLAVPTAKSPTTWLTIVLSVLLVILFNFIGHDAAQRVLPSGLVNFFESAWPMLALVLVFILLGSKGHPWDYFVGAVFGNSRGKRRR
jgi:uncharacterized membrane protein YgcG